MAIASPTLHKRRWRQPGQPFALQLPPRLALGMPGAFAIITLLWAAGQLFLSSAGSAPLPKDDLALMMADPSCTPYADAIQEAAEGPDKSTLELNQAQMLWVATLVQGQAALRGRPARLLVFGYHLHSDVLHAVNCQGRTVFLESSLEQIDTVKKAHPFLEVHIVHYRAQDAHAGAFLLSPWLIEAPPEVHQDDCYDVTLVDTPAKLNEDKQSSSGRLESVHFALHSARRCIVEGKLGDAVILLHDSQRPLEQLLVQKLLLAPDASGATSVRSLGTIKDANLGDLTAFRVTRAAGGELRRIRKLQATPHWRRLRL